MENNNKKIAEAALAGIVALGIGIAGVPTAQAAPAIPPDVKCYGVAAGNKNDCGTVVSSCAATVAQAGACYAWIYTPKGICEKISGSSVENPAANCKGPDGKPIPASK